MDLNLLVPLISVAVLVVFLVTATVRVVPQARRYNVERFGRYRTTLQPGLNFIIPVADRINTKLDVREQVYSSQPKPVITEDNLVVNIDTVLYYQITDPRAAAYEVADYLQAIDQLTVTTLRNVIGSMDLERTLTSREEINTRLRIVLDEATGKWGIRVNRVEIKAIDPPLTIKEAMEKQMRAERDKPAAILHAEGDRQAKILTAEGTRQQEILVAQGDQQAASLRADGEATAVALVFQELRLHTGQDLPSLPRAAPVIAIDDGTVISAHWDQDYGNIVSLRHGNGVITRYGHLASIDPKIIRGARVGIGQRIGIEGSPGTKHWVTPPLPGRGQRHPG
jgi:regulator of protease activity HflC (stomatin/prohibitin superfamily)